jgi:hypothetical protein
MSTLPGETSSRTLSERTAKTDYAAHVCEAIACIAAAPDTAAVLCLMRRAVNSLGADAGVFTSFVLDDGASVSYRSLLACDPVWGTEYARNLWFLNDPWLRHAACNASSVRASELAPPAPDQMAASEAATRFGFLSAVVVPAPSPAGRSRVGALCLGSATEGYFECDGDQLFRFLAQSLAMELHDWCFRRARDELKARVKITDDDLTLLRYEQQRRSSKAIAIELNTTPRTIDCRFQRLTSRLGMANRRTAVRFAELYGLIARD